MDPLTTAYCPAVYFKELATSHRQAIGSRFFARTTSRLLFSRLKRTTSSIVTFLFFQSAHDFREFAVTRLFYRI
jgi:hypothetical protein